MSKNTKRWGACLMMVAVGMIGPGCGRGCGSRTEQTGEFGELNFSYQAASGRRDFSRPIAQGATLIMTVEGADDERVERITELSAAQPSILEVARGTLGGDQLLVTGLTPGESLLKVSAQLAGESHSRADQIRLSVAKVNSASLSHHCVDTRDAAYLEGLPMTLDFSRYDARNVQLVGRGGCGVQVNPPLAGLIGCDEATLTFPEGIAQTGTVELDTGLPAPRQRSGRVALQVVSLELLDFAPVQSRLEAGSTERVTLRPQTPNWPICTDLEFEVQIITTRTCAWADSSSTTRFSVGAVDRNAFRLRGRAPGECAFNVSLPRYGISDIWAFSIPVFESDD